MDIQISISPGELLDRISILEIKQYKLKDILSKDQENKLKQELYILDKATKCFPTPKVGDYFCWTDLTKVNMILWDLEEKVRWHEKNNDFSEGFIEAARLIYKTNDERSRLKNKINELLNSEMLEVKSYQDY